MDIGSPIICFGHAANPHYGITVNTFPSPLLYIAPKIIALAAIYSRAIFAMGPAHLVTNEVLSCAWATILVRTHTILVASCMADATSRTH